MVAMSYVCIMVEHHGGYLDRSCTGESAGVSDTLAPGNGDTRGVDDVSETACEMGRVGAVTGCGR